MKNPDKNKKKKDMRSEYDFTGGVVPPKGAVIVEADLRPYFPDSESVNKALRCLIPLLSKRVEPRQP